MSSCAALLNSQPMGFYAPAQIVRDAREHGVDVRPVCVNASRFRLHTGTKPAKKTASPSGLASAWCMVFANADAADLSPRGQMSPTPRSMISGAAQASLLPPLVRARRGRRLPADTENSPGAKALWAIKALRDEPCLLLRCRISPRSKNRPELHEPTVTLRAYDRWQRKWSRTMVMWG